MNFPVDLKEKWGGRRYNSFNHILKKTFHSRVYKVRLSLDFTCPNRDGTVTMDSQATDALAQEEPAT